MLEHYFVRPSTLDRIRASWLGSPIERYVEWLEAHGYTRATVVGRVPLLVHFADFAQKYGCTDIGAAGALVEPYVSQLLSRNGAETKTSASLRKHKVDAESVVLQTLRLACEGGVKRNRHCQAFPLKSEAPEFADYLRSERGLNEVTIYTYRRHLKEFADFLSQAGVASLSELSPALLASFIIDRAPRMAPRTRRDLCGHLRVFLRFCHRKAITKRDLSGAVGMSQVYRLNDGMEDEQGRRNDVEGPV